MNVQKFFKGDLVRIGSLPVYMSHFPQDCEAIVLYSNREKNGRYVNTFKYGLYILGRNGGESSWYPEDALTFVREDAYDALPQNQYDRLVYEAKLSRWYRDFETEKQ